MSVACGKCGADISWENEWHPNCDRVVALQAALREALDDICVQHCLGESRIAELRKQFLEDK